LTLLPTEVRGVRRVGKDGITLVAVAIKDASGDLLPTAIPKVAIVKGPGQYAGDAPLGDGARDPEGEVGIRAAIDQALSEAPLAGFVGEGLSPYGALNESADAMLRRAVFSGLPVVKVGRGNNEGFAYHTPPFLAGGNLTANKARLVLMACLMKFGSLPPAADPTNPTPAETAATSAALANYQQVFDTH